MINKRVVFCHEWKRLLFRSDYRDVVLLDKCRYHLERPFEMANGEPLVSLEDALKLLAPDLRAVKEGDKVRLYFRNYLRLSALEPRKKVIDGGSAYWNDIEEECVELTVNSSEAVKGDERVTLSVAPFESDGVFYLPVLDVLEKAFGAHKESVEMGGTTFWKKKVENRRYVFAYYDEKAKLDPRSIEIQIDVLFKKNWGETYETVWFEEGQRLMPVRMYVPSSYRNGTPNKAILLFHGGGTNENVYYDDSHGKLEFYAEKYGYVTIAPTSYGVSTFFGSLIPILQTYDGIDPDEADPKNPEGWPIETLELRAMANRAVWKELDWVFANYSIDKENLFGQGNSAGSNALTYFALEYPGLMKAIIPGAGWVNPNFCDMSRLKDTPIMHLIGSEDHHGVDYIKIIYEICDKYGLDVEKHIVGGAGHFDAWVFIIDEMFDFYNRHVKQ